MEKTVASPVPAVFMFHSHSVRTIERDGELWFVANDVADILGYSDCKQAVRDHCKFAELLKGVESAPFTSSPRGINIIPERDVYRLIVKSTLPTAEKFEEWVFGEVLPSIRKHGHYGQAPAIPTDPMAILKLVFDAQTQTNLQVAAVEAKV